MNQPLVSIVIPVFNGRRFLVESVRSCLKQSFENLEVILVDDASHDGSARMLRRMARIDSRIRTIHHHQNRGVAATLNAGFETARGQYLTRLAQDDVFQTTAIQTMLHGLQRHPEVGLVYCDMDVIDESGRLLHRRTLPEPEQVLADGNHVGLCVMWTRKVWETVGGFDPRYDLAEDYEYWLRISHRFRLLRVPEAPFLLRLHSGTATRRHYCRQLLATAQAELTHQALSASARSEKMSQALREAGWHAAATGHPADALRYFTESLRVDPGNVSSLRGLVQIPWTVMKAHLRRRVA